MYSTVNSTDIRVDVKTIPLKNLTSAPELLQHTCIGYSLEHTLEQSGW